MKYTRLLTALALVAITVLSISSSRQKANTILESGDTTYTSFIDHELRFISKTGISSGVLYDRVMPLAGLHEFGKIQPDTSTARHFMQAYYEMYLSAYDRTNWIPSAYIDALAYEKSTQNLVPIGIADYNFHLIDTNAVSSNLLRLQDSVLYDVSGRPRHPFNQVRTIIASPLMDNVPLSFSYVIGGAFTVLKGGRTISALKVDFADGLGLRTVGVNSTVPVTYPSAGYKVLRFVITLSGAGNVTTYAIVRCQAGVSPTAFLDSSSGAGTLWASSATDQLEVSDLWQADEYPQGRGPMIAEVGNLYGSNHTLVQSGCVTTSSITAKISFKGYDESAPAYGFGEVGIYHATNRVCDGTIRKPIIIVDGFDPGDTRDLDKLYDDKLDITPAGVSVSMAAQLRSAGYDIILLNFPVYKIGSISFLHWTFPIYRDGGADYIERNAMTLVALIDSVNQVKIGNEKLVIVGPSMGGLVSQYALSYMEANNKLHKTRLWISFDAPHKGANIPIGDQRFLEFLSSMSKSAKDNLTLKLGSPAAKQMLLHHYTHYPYNMEGGWTITQHTESPTSSGFRTTFLNNINNLGFPAGDSGQPFRKLALTNGSLGGNGNHTQCQRGFTFDIRHIVTRLFFFKIKFKTFSIAEAKMNFTPGYGATCTVFEGWKPFGSTRRRVQAFSGTSGNDNAAGSTFNTQEVLQKEGSVYVGTENFHTWVGKAFNTLTWGIFNVKADFYSVVPTHTFINTKSTLAFSGTNQDLSENISGRNLVCTGETPFDSYFGSFTANTEHVTFWRESIDWLFKEIQGNPQPPSVLSPATISGLPIICTSSTYTIIGLPTGSNILSWSVEPSNAVSLTGSGNSRTVSKNGNFSGLITLTVVISSPSCGASQIQKQITIGGGSEPQIFDLPSSLCGGGTYLAYGTHPTSTYYHWQVVGGTINLGQNSPSMQFTADYLTWPNTSGTVGITLTVHGECGNPLVKGISVPVTQCGPGGGSMGWLVYPNPANESLSVGVIVPAEDTRHTTAAPVYKAILYDSQGKQLRQGGSKEGLVQFDTRSLAEGTYFLHIHHDGEVEKRQIVIRH